MRRHRISELLREGGHEVGTDKENKLLEKAFKRCEEVRGYYDRAVKKRKKLPWILFETPYHVDREEQAVEVVQDGATGGVALSNHGLSDDGGVEVDESLMSWLLERCTLHLYKIDNSLMTGADLSKSIVDILISSRTADQIQGELLDLLGMSEDTFEFLIELIEKREQIVAASRKKQQQQQQRRAPPPSPKRDRDVAPIFAPASRSGTGSKSTTQVFIESNQPGNVSLPSMKPGARPAGTSEQHIEHTPLTGPGSKVKEGEEVTKTKFVQVDVPAKVRVSKQNLPRVPISAFSSLAQTMFKGVDTLNPMQSAVFDCAYFTNNNMLVCAPTGAGKTNVAMMTVAREVERNQDDIHAIKIIYVAPMKALAQEVVEKFGERLKPLGIRVRELTGDMQLSRTEIENTQLIVTTPEKWDVITRKSGDGTLVEAVRLLIIDEVHLIGEDRGPVIESLVARTLRLVEQKQVMVRIVGLSATLPNYRDAAQFLRVDLNQGMFFFDNAYRPVPLDQTFIGVKEKNLAKRLAMLNDIAFLKAQDSVRRGHQVMIFVHSRKDTSNTARQILEAANMVGDGEVFGVNCKIINDKARKFFEKDVSKSKSSELRELFQSGIGIHHAGMLRADRTLTEKMFSQQAISVLVCTATLAWGVNLPVHTVIIKGTQVYVAEKGGLVELNMQDVFQCFGRAGRPQFDTSGEAILITEYDQLNRYLSMLNHALPLESHLDKRLPDALNAEVVSGTVTNLEEAVEWLSYTFLYIRMLRNPMRYGITYKERELDPMLHKRRADIIISAARELDRAKMSRFARTNDMQSPFGVTDLGRVASHFYIGHNTIEEFNQKLRNDMNDAQVIDLLCRASEFEQLKVRDEEITELNKLQRGCPIEILADPNSPRAKAAILLQCYITRSYIQNFTLSSDMNYISQNMGRVARAVFEICMKKRWSAMSEKMLVICTALERRCWWEPYSHPLRQFSPELLALDVVRRLEDKGDLCHVENLVDMEPGEIGQLIRLNKMGDKIASAVRKIPYVHVSASLQPLTRSILRVTVDLSPDFEWKDRFHGKVQNFWMWVDDQNSEWIYHSERFTLHKADALKATRRLTPEEEEVINNSKMHPALKAIALQNANSMRREFTIPIFEPLPSQYFLRIFSESWLGSEAIIPLQLDGLVLPPKVKQHTDLLSLTPLPRSALKVPEYIELYAGKFTHFNPIQTQIFHVMYHTDKNVLLGAPTGSGKTISSELALLRMFRDYPGAKAVYIAPLKALVSERVREWKKSIQGKLGKKVVEFTGDVTPDPQVLRRADVLISTPEKWDGASRMWAKRDYVKQVRLVIIDEIHLLGEERGAVLEVLVTRMRYIAAQEGHQVRIVGLSTALANAYDLGNWLGIEQDGVGLYNFRPAVRPVPLEAHIHGFPGQHYCPRMATMNKPAYQAIITHSPEKPVLIFVASRRQTRLTALDLISLCAGSDHPRRFLHMDFEEMESIITMQVKDDTLKHTLAFGIGIHHAGLDSGDRDIVENLFCSGKIQILCCTATLAWGVNFPAHLVIIKGTEFYDGKTKRYQPFPVTDVLQMMGRAGRPQYDTSAVAMIFVEESLKPFYKKFLYEPFPVESHLPEFLHNHLNAEIASGTICDERGALDYLSWTYFFRRLPMNPSYYGLSQSDPDSVAIFLIQLVHQILVDLERTNCIKLEGKKSLLDGQDEVSKWRKFNDNTANFSDKKELLDQKLAHVDIVPTQYGKICSFYYLDYRTMSSFTNYLKKKSRDMPSEGDDLKLNREILALVAGSHEYSQVPVRHNEDSLNLEYCELLPWNPYVGRESWPMDSSHAKAFLLLQAHCCRVPAPIKDYINDTKTVLDQSLRVINAVVEVAMVTEHLNVALAAMELSQAIIQGVFFDHPWAMQLPHISKKIGEEMKDFTLLDLMRCGTDEEMARKLSPHVKSSRKVDQIVKSVRKLPLVHFQVTETGNNMYEISFIVQNADRNIGKTIPFSQYNKSPQYAWWIILADAENKALYCKHFIGLPKELTCSFNGQSKTVKPTTAYLISGSIVGIDQRIMISQS